MHAAINELFLAPPPAPSRMRNLMSRYQDHGQSADAEGQ
jgi:hypothetical protein